MASIKSGFWEEVRGRLGWKDLFIVASVPVVLGLIFFLFPESIQSSMALNYESPSLPTFFTHTLVHGNISHLSGNILVYLVAAVPILIMSALSGEKRIFYAMFLVFIFVFPFIISGIDAHYINIDKPGRGFSGISSAFLGLMPISLFLFLREKVRGSIKKGFPLSLLLFGLGTAGLVYAGTPTVRILSFGAIVSLGAFFLWWSLRDVDLRSPRRTFRGDRKTDNYIWLAALSVLMFLFGSTMLFPQQIVEGGKVINVLSHYSGFALGYFVPYFTLEAQRLAGQRDLS